jgi:hypothetical protein
MASSCLLGRCSLAEHGTAAQAQQQEELHGRDGPPSKQQHGAAAACLMGDSSSGRAPPRSCCVAAVHSPPEAHHGCMTPAPGCCCCCAAAAADCHAVVPRARGAAGHHPLLHPRGHVERGLHLCRAGPQGGSRAGEWEQGGAGRGGAPTAGGRGVSPAAASLTCVRRVGLGVCGIAAAKHSWPSQRHQPVGLGALQPWRGLDQCTL